MPRSTDRIVTTHAGSLPRPDDIVEMIWGGIDGTPPDQATLDARLAEAFADVVRRQRESGVDVVSDGEVSKPGFSNCINDRFTGFEGRAEFQADDVAPFPNLAMRLFATPAMAHLVFANCVGPVEVKDPDAVHRDVERLKAALGGTPPGEAFMGAISPGQVAFNFPRPPLRLARGVPRRARRGAAARVQGDHGRRVQPADRLARPRHGGALPVGRLEHPELGHAPADGDRGAQRRARRHPRGAGAAARLLGQLRRPAPQGRAAARHHRAGLKANAGTFYVEGANPRHEHEWEVFKEVSLPEGKDLILGVIDVKVNAVEHPRLVAQRLVRLAEVVGRENVQAGTDCGFDTFIRFSQVDPDVVWLKLQALSEGAEMASQELWGR
jgi:5-methyltetrahydropteroyltriglutamate--homocysteine methyltransferase